MLDIFKQRRSCRKYDSSRPVEIEKINEVINAGLYAASGLNYQYGIIIAITDKTVRDKLATLNTKIGGAESDMFYGAPVILLVAVKKWRNACYDGSTMIENMLLEATNQGLGSCWIHRAKEELESEEGREILSSVGLDLNEYEGVGHVALGYSLIDEYKPKAIKDGRVFWIK